MFKRFKKWVNRDNVVGECIKHGCSRNPTYTLMKFKTSTFWVTTHHGFGLCKEHALELLHKFSELLDDG